jgi:hypothetical protein
MDNPLSGRGLHPARCFLRQSAKDACLRLSRVWVVARQTLLSPFDFSSHFTKNPAAGCGKVYGRMPLMPLPIPIRRLAI